MAVNMFLSFESLPSFENKNIILHKQKGSEKSPERKVSKIAQTPFRPRE